MKRLALILLATLTLLAPALPAMAFNPLAQPCNGPGSNSPVCKSSQTSQNPDSGNPALHIMHLAVDIMAILVGIFAVIMIIIGGLNMVTSGGSSEKVASARGRILNAVVALVITALAWTIVTFIINRITT